VLDLIFRVSHEDGWTATLRNEPSVVLVADGGEKLAEISKALAIAILQGRGTETLEAMREAGWVLPEPETGPGS
jgi:hypothetical protein